MASADTSANPPPKSTQLPTAKLTAIARFKSLTGSLMSIREKRPQIIFPPPSWDIEDLHTSSDRGTAQTSHSGTTSNTQDAPTSASSAPEDVEPVTFAMKLRAMIELLPIPAAIIGFAGKEQHATPESSSQPPVPHGIDPELVKMLSSEEVMNGDVGKGGKDQSRQSVWNILAGLRRNENVDSNGAEKGIASPMEQEDDGLMMYAPLEPNNDSQVSLAESQTIVTHPTSPTIPSTAKDKTDNSIPTPSPRVVESRVWVPSTTEISVLTVWWGYRLYLPPPVMAKLGASTVKAAARAAMITSALKWMLDKIPLALIPVQFRPAVMMLKRLTPIASYVGVFIAWSWDRIRALDEGNGVVLTATWLLPVALLPMAWDAGAIYQPILLPNPEELRKAEAATKSQENKDNKDATDSKNKKSRFRLW